MKKDQENIEQLLQTAVSTAIDFLQTLLDRPAAISNWQTEQADMEVCWQALLEAVA